MSMRMRQKYIGIKYQHWCSTMHLNEQESTKSAVREQNSGEICLLCTRNVNFKESFSILIMKSKRKQIRFIKIHWYNPKIIQIYLYISLL